MWIRPKKKRSKPESDHWLTLTAPVFSSGRGHWKSKGSSRLVHLHQLSCKSTLCTSVNRSCTKTENTAGSSVKQEQAQVVCGYHVGRCWGFKYNCTYGKWWLNTLPKVQVMALFWVWKTTCCSAGRCHRTDWCRRSSSTALSEFSIRHIVRSHHSVLM